jgi:hypothetical protein
MVHHPPMDQLQGFEYCIDSNPSWGLCHLISQVFGIFYPVTCIANLQLLLVLQGRQLLWDFSITYCPWALL